MAESFAIGTAQPVGQGRGAAPQALQAGVVGGNVSNPDLSIDPGALKPKPSALDSLLAVGGKVLEGKVKQEQEARFVQGMSKAAQGVAAQEIQNSRPAWAQLFGEGIEVQGARAYEGQRDAADFEASLAQTAAEDAALPPEQYAAALKERVGKATEGLDPTRSQTFQGYALSKIMPQRMKDHAIQHAKYAQLKADEVRGQAINSTLTALQRGVSTLRESGTLTPESLAATSEQALAMLAPAEGENTQRHQQQVLEALQAQVARGEFEVVGMLQRTGAWNALPIKAQDTLANQVRASANYHIKQKLPPDIRDRIMALGNIEGATSDQINQVIDEVNRQMRERTGVPADLLDESDRQRYIGMDAANVKATDVAEARAAREAEIERRSAIREAKADARANAAEARERAAQQREALKEQRTMAGVASIIEAAMAAPGGWGRQASVVDPAADKLARQYITERWGGLPIDQKIKLAAGSDGKLPPVESGIQKVLTSTTLPAELGEVMSIYRGLDPASQKKVYLANERALLDDYNRIEATLTFGDKRPAPAEVWERVQTARIQREATKPLSGNFGKVIDKEFAKYNGPLWTSTVSTKAGENLAKGIVARIADAMPGGSEEEQVRNALQALPREGFRDYGKVQVLDKTQGDSPATVLGLGSDMMVGSAILGAAKAQLPSLKEGKITGIVRVPGPDLAYQVMVEGAKGKTLTLRLSRTDLEEQRDRDFASRRK